MKEPVSVKIKKSNNKGKKLVAEFIYSDGTKSKTHFGASGYSDYTKHKDSERKERYLARHEVNEDWNDPTSAGALSRWVLWNKPDLEESIEDYQRRFNLKPYNRLIGGIGFLRDRGVSDDSEIYWTRGEERTPANVHEERLDRLSERLDSDIEYLDNGEQRMVYAPTDERPGELDGKVLKVSRYYVYDKPPKNDFSTGFWEDHVSLHFAEKTPFMLDFIVPGEPVLPPLDTEKQTMAGQSVIQPKVKTGFKGEFTNDIGRQWYSDVRKTVLEKYEQGKIDGETKDALIDWAGEQDLGDGNFGFYEGEWRILDYYGIPDKYFEIKDETFFTNDFEERDQDGEGADLIAEGRQEDEVRMLDWDFDDSELIGWNVDEVDLSDEGGRDSDYENIRTICLGCGVSPGICVCTSTRTFDRRKSASLPTDAEPLKRRRRKNSYMASGNQRVTWRTPAPTRSIEKVMWDRWDMPGNPMGLPMTKAKAKSIANNIRTKKGGGGVHLARVIPVKGGYLVYERPKDRKWTSSRYIKRQKMSNRGPGGNLYLRKRR